MICAGSMASAEGGHGRLAHVADLLETSVSLSFLWVPLSPSGLLSSGAVWQKSSVAKCATMIATAVFNYLNVGSGGCTLTPHSLCSWCAGFGGLLQQLCYLCLCRNSVCHMGGNGRELFYKVTMAPLRSLVLLKIILKNSVDTKLIRAWTWSS